jgi:ribosome maturation factor RimP
MDKKTLLDRIEVLIKPVITSEGMELVDLEFKKEGKHWYLRIFIDKPGGVSLDDCQNISHQLGVLLDVEEVINQHYILEVSSPGLDRPLKKEEDYHRFAGRLVKITTSISIKGRKRFIGRLEGLEDEVVKLRLERGGMVSIPFESINKAQLEVEFLWIMN